MRRRVLAVLLVLLASWLAGSHHLATQPHLATGSRPRPALRAVETTASPPAHAPHSRAAHEVETAPVRVEVDRAIAPPSRAGATIPGLETASVFVPAPRARVHVSALASRIPQPRAPPAA